MSHKFTVSTDVQEKFFVPEVTTRRSRRSPVLAVTLWNMDDIRRLAQHYHAKARLYMGAMDLLYEQLTGKGRWYREMQIDLFGYQPRPAGIVPEDLDTWLRYEHDYYRHLAWDAISISQQVLLSLLSPRLSRCLQGPLRLLHSMKLEYPYDPQCYLLREQARARLRSILRSWRTEVAITQRIAVAMDETEERHYQRKRRRRKRCETCYFASPRLERLCDQGLQLAATKDAATTRVRALLATLPPAKSMSQAQVDVLQEACVAHINGLLDWREHELGTTNY